ncbi:hypothetical protein CR513_29550, partial [Mucuna pruriens]
MTRHNKRKKLAHNLKELLKYGKKRLFQLGKKNWFKLKKKKKKSGKILVRNQRKNNTNVKGPMDLLFFKKPKETIQLRKTKRQTSINDIFHKESRARTIQYIACFFLGMEFHSMCYDKKCFKLIIEAVSNYSSHVKPLSYHELKVPLLKMELEYTRNLLKGHAEEQIKYGCSIISYGWMDRKNKILINFLVNFSLGTMFVKSVDVFEYLKTEGKICEFLSSFAEEVGKKNVIQVVTNIDNNYVMVTFTSYKTKIILDDVDIKIIGYIWKPLVALNTMRKFTNKVFKQTFIQTNPKSKLVRHGVTRYMHKQKANIRRMFISNK